MKFDEGLALFDQELFWEACLALDEAWQEEPTQFCQGLIYLSAGFYHLQRQNLYGSRSLLELAVEYLAPYAWATRSGTVAGAVTGAVEILRGLRESSHAMRIHSDPCYPKLGQVPQDAPIAA